jgi:hypothetical protein
MELRRTIGARRVRLTSAVDDESRRFEDDLVRRLAASSESGAVRELPWIQTHAHLELCAREFRLLQVRDASGAPSAQIAVYLSRPRRARWFASGVAERFGPAADGEEEEFALKTLRELLAELGEVMSLRLRPERYEPVELWNFQERAQRTGYRLADAEDVTRTLLRDLRPSEEELMASLGRKVRANFRSEGLSRVEIRRLADARFLPQCRDALNAAFARTSAEKVRFDFETAFALAARAPDRACVLGLFLKDRPDKLLAYALGFRSGAAAEYASAGSLNDPELRDLPFSSWLLWDLMLWAKRSGAVLFDLRGVTGGGSSDPLSGISGFKRRFASQEIEINREMTAVLKPKTHAVFRSLRRLRGRRK